MAAASPAGEAPPAKEPLGRIHLLISGRVQGVGFRAFTQAHAKKLGLKGWVRNLSTGDVELEAEGSEAALKALEEKVKTGPEGSRVDKIERKAASSEALGEFEIRKSD
ncbi:MAG TPA: acylphosphatase [Planctomycetota bacterium]|nr:acylphosphatase [Planctomycetota bacterium]